MIVEAGQSVVLGGTRYRITAKLGSGAVSDVYRATPEGITAEVAVKVVRQDAHLDEEGREKIEGLRQEGRVLTILNQAEDPQWSMVSGLSERIVRAQRTACTRLIIALLDRGDITPEQPYLVQELAPPALERFDITTRADERRMLTVALALARAMALAHQHSFSLRDFDPSTKLDRVRVRWLQEQDACELKLIDWNITGGPEGIPQDLVCFGGHLYYLLVGRQLTFDAQGRLPVNLALGAPGWASLTEGSRQILQRLLHSDPGRRYRRAADVEADLSWWLKALHQAEEPRAAERLQELVWEARAQERYDRVLAVAVLAQDLAGLDAASREAFVEAADQARSELERETWRPIAEARVSLLRGNYQVAVSQFDAQLRQLDERHRAAEMARRLRLQALAGQLLKDAYGGLDIRGTHEWTLLTQAADALVRGQWSEAETALERLRQLRPETASWPPVRDQLALVRAGQLLDAARQRSVDTAPQRLDAEGPDWAVKETALLERLQQVVADLQQAVRQAPTEPQFSDELRAAQTALERRQASLRDCRAAEELLAHAQRFVQRGRDALQRRAFEAAATDLGQALAAVEQAQTTLRLVEGREPGHYRLRRLQQEAQRWRSEANPYAKLASALADVRRLAERGLYREALDRARPVAIEYPGEAAAQGLLAELEACARLEGQARSNCDMAEGYLTAGDSGSLSEAERCLQRILAMAHQPLAQLAAESLAVGVESRTFVLAPDVTQRATALRDEVYSHQHTASQVEGALQRHDHELALSLLRKQREKGKLTRQEETWERLALARLDAETQARQYLAANCGFEDLRKVHELIPANDPNPRAIELRKQAALQWWTRVRDELDWSEAADRLREGFELFRSEYHPEALQARQLAGIARRVQSWLEPAVTGKRPVWFELPRSQLRERLLQLEVDLLQLADSADWPRLAAIAGEWRNRLVNDLLPAHLRPYLRRAQSAARERDYDAALQVAEEALAPLPETFRKHLPRDVGADGLEAIIRGVRNRREIEQKLRELMVDVRQGQSFADLALRLKAVEGSLQGVPDTVPVDDLWAVFSQFERGVRWQASLGAPKDPTYAQQIYDRWLWSREEISHLEEPWSGLETALQRVQQSLRDSLQQASRELQARLEGTLDALIRNPQDKDVLAEIFWLIPLVRYVEVMAGEAQGGFQDRLKPKGRELLSLAVYPPRGLDDLERACYIFETARTLNAALAGVPQSDQYPLPPQLQCAELSTPWNASAIAAHCQAWAELRAQAKGGASHDEEGSPAWSASPAAPSPLWRGAGPGPRPSPPQVRFGSGAVWGATGTASVPDGPTDEAPVTPSSGHDTHSTSSPQLTGDKPLGDNTDGQST